MPRQANGTYIQPANTAAVTLTSISSVAFNTLETDIGTEITNSVDRLGRSAMLAALPMGGQKITGMATPTISTDAVTKAYADALGPTAFIVTGTGTADVITGVFTPTITALTNGLTVEVRATAANATTTPTFQADATAAKTIVKGAGVALIAGNIAGAGFWMSLTYDSVLDKWVLNNPSITLPTAVIPIASASGLIVVSSGGTPNTNIDVFAEQVVMLNASNAPFFASGIALTINTSTTGANGLDTGARGASSWYNMFLISDGVTTAGLASLSSTTPTMPGAYTYKMRVGVMRTDGSGNFLRSRQAGNKVTNLTSVANLPSIVTTNVGGTYVASSISNFAPPTAVSFFPRVWGQTNGVGPSFIGIAGYQAGTAPSTQPFPEWEFEMNSGTVIMVGATPEIYLLSNNIFIASQAMTTVDIAAAGWRDKVNAT